MQITNIITECKYYNLPNVNDLAHSASLFDKHYMDSQESCVLKWQRLIRCLSPDVWVLLTKYFARLCGQRWVRGRGQSRYNFRQRDERRCIMGEPRRQDTFSKELCHSSRPTMFHGNGVCHQSQKVIFLSDPITACTCQKQTRSCCWDLIDVSLAVDDGW